MLGQVARGLGGRRLCAALGQAQRQLRRRIKRVRTRLLLVGQHDIGAGGGRAVIIRDFVVKFQRAIGGAFRLLGKADRRGRVGNDGENPIIQRRLAGSQGQNAIGHQLAGKFPGRCPQGFGAFGRSRRLGRRFDGRDVAHYAGSLVEGERFIARPAGHAQDEIAASRYGESSYAAVVLRGQEDRRLAGIGRRRHPGIDARWHRRHARRGAEGIGHPAAEGTVREGKRCEQQQRRQGAQPPGIAFRNAGARHVASQVAQPIGHALLVFTP